MKKILYILVLLPWMAAAQVEKQVEVTKAYVPNVESASKIAVIPDMTDTVKMSPEIDYTITPLSLRTTLATRPIRPATVTYWEFNRPRPFYLKVGAGYPLNSVLDFYAATQNPSTGYAVGYVNHEGRYAKIRNAFDRKNNSTRMSNRIGAAAGKYFGRRTLEGELAYENRLYNFYAMDAYDPAANVSRPEVRNDYNDARVDVRFGDNFQDLSRLNFEVGMRGGFFWDAPHLYQYEMDGDALKASRMFGKSRQTSFDVYAGLAKAFGRHRLSVNAGYERLAGQKQINGITQHQIRVGARYGLDGGGVVRLEAGVDYLHDKITDESGENYILPFLRADLNLGTDGMKPFLEIDGQVQSNDFRSLTRHNPYVAAGTWGNKSSVDYNGRFGIGGSMWHAKFSYRAYAAFSIHDNHLYWFGMGNSSGFFGLFSADIARQTVTSFNGEVDYRPLSPLHLSLGAHGYLYNNDSKYRAGAPSFIGNAAVRYESRKIMFGVELLLESERKWTLHSLDEDPQTYDTSFTAPFEADLRVNFEWKVSPSTAVFAEGRNLINRRLYAYGWYPEYGANFTVGVKLNF